MLDKNIIIISYTNKVYREKFISKGWNVSEFSLPPDAGLQDAIRSLNFSGTALIEIIDNSLTQMEEIFAELRKTNSRLIALAANINKLSAFFIKYGIAEVLESGNAGKAAAYVELTSREENKRYGKIVLLETDLKKKNIFETIIGRFNYTPVFAGTTDELCGIISEINIQLAFANLGAEKFEISEFLRKIIPANSKKVPVIPYKDENPGLFIHEMISGLNRVSKIILTTEEAYSFLITILFRKELSPGLDLLNEALDYRSNINFISEPLNRIYTLMGIEVFNIKNIISHDNVNIINGRIDALRNLILKADGLKWLLRENISKPSTVTTTNTGIPL